MDILHSIVFRHLNDLGVELYQVLSKINCGRSVIRNRKVFQDYGGGAF